MSGWTLSTTSVRDGEKRGYRIYVYVCTCMYIYIYTVYILPVDKWIEIER